MDPEANLAEQIQIAKRLYEIDDSDPDDFDPDWFTDEISHLAMRLAELVFALHSWNKSRI